MSTMILVAAILWIMVGVLSAPIMFIAAEIHAQGGRSLKVFTHGLFPPLIVLGGLASILTAARHVHPVWSWIILALPLVCPLVDYAADPKGNLVYALSNYGQYLKFWRWWV